MAVTLTSTYAGPARFHGDLTDTDSPHYPEVCKLNDALTSSVQTALTAGFGDELTIEPWRATAFPVLKDLVVDRGALDRYARSQAGHREQRRSQDHGDRARHEGRGRCDGERHFPLRG